MTTIRRLDRGGEWWVDFRYRRKRLRKRSPVQTKRGAEQFERQLRQEFAEDETHGRNPFAGPPPLLRDFVDRWFAEYVVPRNKRSTCREKRYAFTSHLLPALGALRLDEITAARIARFSSERLERGASPKRVKNLLTVLRRCLVSAHEWGLIRAVPHVQWPRVPVPEPKYLQRHEYEALIRALPGGFWYTLTLLVVTTGLRFGEAAALRWDDLVLDGPEPSLRVRRRVERGHLDAPKSRKSRRTVPIPAQAARALRDFQHSRPYIFARESGAFLRPDYGYPTLDRAAGQAGLGRVRWHMLRHSYGTELVAKGTPLNIVQELLGHETLEMTARYCHAAPSTLRHYTAIFDAPSQDEMAAIWPPSDLSTAWTARRGSSESAQPSEKRPQRVASIAGAQERT